MSEYTDEDVYIERISELNRNCTELDTQLVAAQQKLAELEETLGAIAFIGMDCPMQADKEYFYSFQLIKCVALAAAKRKGE